ncbi:MAG: ankyrin repeat domain-containing protein [Draconibacterium sp.]
MNKTNAVLSELSRNSYPVYILHMVVMGVIALTLTGLPIPAMRKFLILSIVTFVVSNMMIYTWRTTLQKQINMKTITTFVLVVLITGAAFRGYPEAINTPGTPAETLAETQPQSQSLHAAVINNDLVSVEILIQSRANVDEREPASGSSPLMTAALFGRTEIVQKLLDAGADINHQNNDGSTALHTAAFFCHPEITKRLLAASTDRSIRNKAGSTALESVLVPFEIVKPIYDYMQKIYEPLGLTIDQDRIQKTRPEIAKLLTEE